MFYWVLKTIVLGPLIRLLFRPWVEGEENIPPEGAAIFASNHLSFSDSIFLPVVVPRRMTFLAKSDYFTGRGIKGRLTAAFFKGVGQLPVDRSGGRAGEAALNSGLKVLRRGELLGIYPEGTRSPDGRLYRGRTGVARMALEAGVPVLPVAMVGTDKAQPTGRKIPKIMRIGVRIGKPLDFSRYEGMEGDRFVLRSITDEIMYELMLLSGQEYVDMYATSVKNRLLAAAKAKAKPLHPGTSDASAADGAGPDGTPTAGPASATTAGDDVADGDRPVATEATEATDGQPATAAQPAPEGGATGTSGDAGQPADADQRVTVGRDRRAAS